MADAALLSMVRMQMRHKWRNKKRPRRYPRPPRWLHPDSIQRDYARRLDGVIDNVRQAYMATIAPRLEGLITAAARSRGDTWSDDLEGLKLSFKKKVQENAPAAAPIAGSVAVRVSEFNLAQWRKITKASLGVDIFASEPWLRDSIKSWADENAERITSLESTQIQDVSTWVQTGIRNGWRHEEIAEKIEERFGVGHSKAAFIARDQVSKLNGQLTGQRQQQLGVEAYFWRGVMDDRERDSHREHEGIRYLWSDPPAETGNPGEDYNCRCWAEPDFSAIWAGIDEDDDMSAAA